MYINKQDTLFDVIAIGNALVDVLAQAKDEFITQQGYVKGAMTLIDAEKATSLYNKMGPAKEISGGSAANSMVGLSSLGGRAAFIGKVAEDTLGHIFVHDIEASGVAFKNKPSQNKEDITGRCYILVSEDAQRTMCTFLGVSGQINTSELDKEAIEKSAILYCEGYLWDREETKATLKNAMKIARDAGRSVAMSLSDTFCVDRHRTEFMDLIDNHIDIVFANENEIKSLFETDDFDVALQEMRTKSVLAILTRGEKGCVVVYGDAVHIVDAIPVEKVLDTTGAGDLFAAGVLYGLTAGLSLPESAKIGALCSSEIIAHYGARPEQILKDFIEQKKAA